MIPNLDIWRCANTLLKHYDADGLFMASSNADTMLDKGTRAVARFGSGTTDC